MPRVLFIALVALALPAAAAAQPDADPDEVPEETIGDEPAEVPAADAPAADEGVADEGVDLQALRAEYLRLRDLLFQSRARAAAVGDALYSSKVTINLTFASGRFYDVPRASIRLDGASVFDDLQGGIARDEAPRFEGFVAPGRHRLAVRIEAVGKDDDRFASVIANELTFQVPAGADVVIDLVASDEGDIPYKWGKKQRGTYDLRLKAKVTAKERKDAQASKQ